MSNCIQQLDDALNLKVDHAERSTSPHPLLLSEELLAANIKLPGKLDRDDTEIKEEDIKEALGSLTISDGNAARFIGVSVAVSLS